MTTTLVWAAIGVFTILAIIIAMLVVNVSQKRRLTRELAARDLELSRANAELKEFSLIAYHDMQEPLRVINSFAQLLEKRYRGQLDQNADEYISFIVQNVNQMKLLFSDLLDYLGLNSKELSCEPLNGSDLLNTVLASLSDRIKDCRAQVTCDRMPVLNGDRSMLTLLLYHLLSNAIKFRGKEPPRVHVSCRREHDNFIVAVSDNGIGIAVEYCEQIFHVFKKLHNSSEYQGTGVGLSICKRVVELHGGWIRVESEPGQGSIFSCSLPAKCSN
jgi:light-regulated signal transduction histidine kinase (bacteriophytochrome)